MARKISSIAPGWWDYTTLDTEIIKEVAELTPEKMIKLSRQGFKVVFYDTLEDFYLAEALEYVTAWRQSTADNPVGICGPIGPTEHLPLVARIVNELGYQLNPLIFGEWMNGSLTERKLRQIILCHLKKLTVQCASTGYIKTL